LVQLPDGLTQHLDDCSPEWSAPLELHRVEIIDQFKFVLGAR
jgi:hypothetical protein